MLREALAHAFGGRRDETNLMLMVLVCSLIGLFFGIIKMRYGIPDNDDVVLTAMLWR